MARRYGTGTVYERTRPDGTLVYLGQWYEGKDGAGRRIRRSVSAPTEAAAWKAMAEARRRPASVRRRGGVTVAAFLGRWLDDVVKPTRRERTYLGYRQIVEQHLVPAFGDLSLSALDRARVQAWVSGQKAAPVTVKHRVDCLRAALGYALVEGHIDSLPTAKLTLPRRPARAVVAMPPSEAKAIIEALREDSIGDLVTVALYTGLRQGELLALKWEDVNLGYQDHGRGHTRDGQGQGRRGVRGPSDNLGSVAALPRASLTVRHSLSRLSDGGVRYVLDDPKTDKSRRTIPLAAPAAEALRQRYGRRNTRSSLIFPAADGGYADGPTVTRQFQAALAAHGLRSMTFHELRHAAASLLIMAGVPLATVADILGHSTITTTVDTYGHLTAEAKRGAVEKLAEAIG